jgi:hypothetical protein
MPSIRAANWEQKRPLRFLTRMEYRGVKYTVVQGSQPDVWRWSVLVGNPEMLRLGDETTEQKAVMEVRRVIDRALAIEKARLGRPD